MHSSTYTSIARYADMQSEVVTAMFALAEDRAVVLLYNDDARIWRVAHAIVRPDEVTFEREETFMRHSKATRRFFDISRDAVPGCPA